MIHTPAVPNNTLRRSTDLDAQCYQKPQTETLLKAALEHARRITDMYGTTNIEVAIAWETVEELQVAKARKSYQIRK